MNLRRLFGFLGLAANAIFVLSLGAAWAAKAFLADSVVAIVPRGSEKTEVRPEVEIKEEGRHEGILIRPKTDKEPETRKVLDEPEQPRLHVVRDPLVRWTEYTSLGMGGVSFIVSLVACVLLITMPNPRRQEPLRGAEKGAEKRDIVDLRAEPVAPAVRPREHGTSTPNIKPA
jgi:hypothetical protein